MISASLLASFAEPRATSTCSRKIFCSAAGSFPARHCSRPKTHEPVNASNAALSDMMPSHLPSQICQRAIGFVATTWIWHSSMSRASVPHASHNVESPSSAVMALNV